MAALSGTAKGRQTQWATQFLAAAELTRPTSRVKKERPDHSCSQAAPVLTWQGMAGFSAGASTYPERLAR